jgi:hypothetical protein
MLPRHLHYAILQRRILQYKGQESKNISELLSELGEMNVER